MPMHALFNKKKYVVNTPKMCMHNLPKSKQKKKEECEHQTRKTATRIKTIIKLTECQHEFHAYFYHFMGLMRKHKETHIHNPLRAKKKTHSNIILVIYRSYWQLSRTCLKMLDSQKQYQFQGFEDCEI